MPIGNRDAAVTTGITPPPPAPPATRSRIGASLRRLHHTLEKTGRVEHGLTDQFARWEQKWASRRDQIAHRLSIIDAQLEQLAQTHLRRPQLSVVTTAEELAGSSSLEVY